MLIWLVLWYFLHSDHLSQMGYALVVQLRSCLSFLSGMAIIYLILCFTSYSFSATHNQGSSGYS